MRILPRVNRLVGQALHDYAMLSDGDQVLVAVSGGVDSLVLAHLLVFWQRKAPVRFGLVFAHVRRDEETARLLRAKLAEAGLDLAILEGAAPPPEAGDPDTSCHLCARARRTRLFAEARRLGCNKLALGHHQDDLIETFLMNFTSAGNLSTMRPKQTLFSGRLALIRPLAYVEKADIERVARENGLVPLPSCCPLGERTRRKTMGELAREIYRRVPGAKRHMFAALGNARVDYLLDGRHAATDRRD